MMSGITPHIMPSLVPPMTPIGAEVTPDGRLTQRFEDALRKRADRVRDSIESKVGVGQNNNRQGASLLAVPDAQEVVTYDLQKSTRGKFPRLLGE